MAHVASNNNGNTNLPNRTPFMDPLTHGVIKEASKSLRYYLDVKRRENAFVLNPSSSAMDPIPLKARFIYGTTKEYPPLYASFHTDNDVKIYLRSFQRQSHSTSNSPEKQMCREELNFHMREHKYSSKENQKFGEPRLGPSNSSYSRNNSPDFRQRMPRSTFKSLRRTREQLVDDTADILATMVKTRQSIYQTNYLSQQVPPVYVSRNANPSPRQIDDQSHIQEIVASLTQPTTDLKPIEKPRKQKRPTKNTFEQAASIMYNAKPIKNGLLCDYKLSVITGNCNGASTNAPIQIKFYGTNGYTKFCDLASSETHRVPFLKDQTDVFTIQTFHVGQLAGITIGHDKKDIRSGWFLDKVSIYDPIREITYEILCNSWLSSKSIDQKTIRDFQVTSMESHKKKHEENDSRSSSSTTTRRSSNTTNGSQNDQLTRHKRTKSHPKQQHVSTDPITTAKKRTSISEITNHLSQPPLPTTVESHFHQREFVSSSVTTHHLASSSVPTRRPASPDISSSSSSETEIEDNIVNGSHSTTPTPSPTRSTADRNSSRTTDSKTNDLYKHHLVDPTRPPARLKNRSSSPSPSPERSPIKNKEETNEDDAHAFFE